MPTYEYACSKCGEHLEVVQSFRDEPLKKCPACGGKLKKVFGNVGIVFKGSGFYKNDSRNGSKSSKVAASSEKGGTSESGSSSESSASSSSSSDTNSSGTSKETNEKSSPDKAASGSRKTGKAGAAAS
ncbi:MAG: FmdB family zinc ribbon protein [Acidimicrobiales bacterium]